MEESDKNQTNEGEVEEINEHKKAIEKLKTKIKNNNKKEKQKLRVKSNSNGKANKLTRVSIDFAKKISYINEKREENGFDDLSGPKITDLIIKHKKYWKLIEKDIINFNTQLDTLEEEFKDEKN